jgi:hypothetical protein
LRRNRTASKKIPPAILSRVFSDAFPEQAVWLSKKLHAAPRAGYFKPYTIMQGVDTIAVPNFNIDFLGHSYYAQAEALLYDIRALMLNGKAPAQRQRIKPANFQGSAFWELKK